MSSHPEVPFDPTAHKHLQEICLAYPEAIEVEAFGAPSFEIRKKKFVMMHRQDGSSLAADAWVKGAPGAQEAYVNSEPERYYVPPYVGHVGWIGIRLDAALTPDWPEIEELIDQSFRLIAPKRVVALLDK